MTADNREQTNYADGYRGHNPYDHESSTLVEDAPFVDAGVTKKPELTSGTVSNNNHGK